MPNSDEKNRKLGHEARSITHGLLGYLAVLNDEISPKLDPGEIELLNRINHYAERLSDLILEILASREERRSR